MAMDICKGCGNGVPKTLGCDLAPRLQLRYDLGILHSVAVQASNVALFGVSIELS